MAIVVIISSSISTDFKYHCCDWCDCNVRATLNQSLHTIAIKLHFALDCVEFCWCLFTTKRHSRSRHFRVIKIVLSIVFGLCVYVCVCCDKSNYEKSNFERRLKKVNFRKGKKRKQCTSGLLMPLIDAGRIDDCCSGRYTIHRWLW